ncbi:hypothetical protein DFAR_3650008 [Desulfarculales bacterium]
MARWAQDLPAEPLLARLALGEQPCLAAKVGLTKVWLSPVRRRAPAACCKVIWPRPGTGPSSGRDPYHDSAGLPLAALISSGAPVASAGLGRFITWLASWTASPSHIFAYLYGRQKMLRHLRCRAERLLDLMPGSRGCKHIAIKAIHGFDRNMPGKNAVLPGLPDACVLGESSTARILSLTGSREGHIFTDP